MHGATYVEVLGDYCRGLPVPQRRRPASNHEGSTHVLMQSILSVYDCLDP